jgi:hypothetical protein
MRPHIGLLCQLWMIGDDGGDDCEANGGMND